MLSAAKRRVDLSTNFATGEVSGCRADWQLDSSVDVKDSRINWKQDSRIRNCGIQLRATSTGFGSWTPKLCRSFSEMRVEPRNSIWGHWRFRHRMAVASRPTTESSSRFSRALDSLGLSEVILGSRNLATSVSLDGKGAQETCTNLRVGGSVFQTSVPSHS